jgi:hypothetical protein
MVQIQPLQIWSNGQTKTAEVLDAVIVNDDLATSCTFYWLLKEADTESQPGQAITQGNVTMTGEDYLGWDGSNAYAYAFIASQINVIILVD